MLAKMKSLALFLLAVPISVLAEPNPVIWCNGKVEVQITKVDVAQQFSGWNALANVSPVDTRDQIHVWIKTKDESVAAFRVSLRFDFSGSISSQSLVITNDRQGALGVFRVPNASGKILSLSVSEMKESSTFEVPQH